jgi:hypothetical protein
MHGAVHATMAHTLQTCIENAGDAIAVGVMTAHATCVDSFPIVSCAIHRGTNIDAQGLLEYSCSWAICMLCPGATVPLCAHAQE